MECLRVGDLVYHSDYGNMVVDMIQDPSVWSGNNNVRCKWWDGNRFLTAYFSADELVLQPIVSGVI